MAEEKLFPLLERSERALVEKMAKVVRRCLRRQDLRPEQIHHLAILLLGLERLPIATPGMQVSLTLSYRTENEMTYVGITLDDSSFSLSSGGSVYDPSVGSDSYGDDVLLVEVGGYRDVNLPACVDWLMSLEARLEDANVEIDFEGDESDLDWDESPDESAWERAEKECDEPDEDSDE
jgi:hypothetical protein